MMQRKTILTPDATDAISRKEQQRRFPQKKRSKGVSPYEQKPLRYLKDNTKFKTSLRSEVWWTVQTIISTTLVYATSDSGQTRKFKRSRKVFTKRYANVLG